MELTFYTAYHFIRQAHERFIAVMTIGGFPPQHRAKRQRRIIKNIDKPQLRMVYIAMELCCAIKAGLS